MTTLVMTLEDMLKVALGTSRPGHVNLAVLHSFLKILIENLDLKSIPVSIDGPQVCELRQMFCQAQEPAVEFKICDEQQEARSSSEGLRMAALEEQVDTLLETVTRLEKDLKGHLEAMQKCKEPLPVSSIQLKSKKKPCDDDFSSQDEDLCDPCDENNLTACSLLQNRDFLKKLMRVVSAPVINKIFDFEKMIQILNEKFQNFLNLAEDEYKKIPLIEDCLKKIATLEMEFRRHMAEFIETMEEIQQMLDAKMDNVHIPAFKKYIMDRLNDVERRLDKIIKTEQCPKAAGVIMQNLQCLCCTSRVCQKDRIFPVPLMAAVSGMDKVKHSKPNLPKLCIPSDRERACGGSHTVIRPGERSLLNTNLIDEFGDKKRLRIGNENVEYFKGTDGGMYRLMPDDDAACAGNL